MTRPTIVIAYGEYGYRILHSLLSNSSERGLLEWSNSKKVDGRKTLHNLELIWLTRKDNQDTGKARQMQEKLRNLDDPIYRDLYQQIKPIIIVDGHIDILIDAVNTAQQRLLAPDQLIQESSKTTSGLDVFFLASLHEDDETLPALDTIMYPLIGYINNTNLHFVNQYQNAPILNFIEILDYERLSSESDEVKSGRYHLKESIASWQSTRRMAKGNSRSFGRVYICDGTSQGTYRNIDLRRKEVVLFLEFLLFESIREGELRHLFESKPNESILSTFGIRLGEQNIEALSQYAAANFAKGWIGYLAGNEFYDGIIASSEVKTEQIVRNVDVTKIAERVRLEDDVKETIDFELSKVKKELADHSKLDVSDILERLEITFINAEAKAAQKISSLLSDIRRKELSKFKEEIIEAISYDLNDSRYPVPIGKLIDILQKQIDEIKELQEKKSTKPDKADSFLNMSYVGNTIAKFYGWYADFLKHRINQQKIRYIWIGFSFVLSMLYMPSFMYALFFVGSDVGPASIISDRAHFFSGHPLFIFVILMFITSVTLSAKAQKYITKKLKSANDWFTQTLRGRLIHALNAVSRNDKLFNKLHDDVYNSLYSEIQQSLHEVKELLEKRRDEMNWLTKSLTDFKKRFKFTDSDTAVLQWDGASIRYEIRKNSDLDKIQSRLVAENHKYADRLESAPACFKDWQNRYDSIFLSPLSFIGQLSKLYSKPFYEDVLRDTEGNNTEEIMKYLRYSSQNLTDGLELLQQEGLYESIKYALLSQEFRGIDKVERQILSHFSIDENHIIDLKKPLRIYLLSIKLGMHKKVLEHIE